MGYSNVGVIDKLSQNIPDLIEVVIRIVADHFQLPLCFV